MSEMSVRPSVRPSVCTSVKRVDCEKTKETYAKIFIPYKAFWEEEEWLVGATPSTWNFWENRHCWSENADFQSIFARNASAVTPSEKRSITNRKSTTRFSMSLRWTSYVTPKPPNGSSKTRNDLFQSKVVLCLKKVCCKVSLSENCQRQSCRTFMAYLSVRKWLVGDFPFYMKIWRILTHPLAKRRFSIQWRIQEFGMRKADFSPLPFTALPFRNSPLCPLSSLPFPSLPLEVGRLNPATVHPLVLISVTLNDLERRNSPYFALFHQIR